MSQMVCTVPGYAEIVVVPLAGCARGEAAADESWPKTTAEFAAYIGKTPRIVQQLIDSGKLKACKHVRPALITQAQAMRFLEAPERRERW